VTADLFSRLRALSDFNCFQPTYKLLTDGCIELARRLSQPRCRTAPAQRRKNSQPVQAECFCDAGPGVQQEENEQMQPPLTSALGPPLHQEPDLLQRGDSLNFKRANG
jgi:hypothetical protein